MTDVVAGQLHRVSKVMVHPLTVRVTHWLNALAMVIMIMSGWRIYNSEPIFPFRFPIALTLGGSFDGSVDLHNEDGLAGALQWHFAGMWLLAINGIVLPNPIDQNPWAHWRSPMDMMRQGWSTSLF